MEAPSSTWHLEATLHCRKGGRAATPWQSMLTAQPSTPSASRVRAKGPSGDHGGSSRPRTPPKGPAVACTLRLTWPAWPMGPTPLPCAIMGPTMRHLGTPGTKPPV